LKLESEAVKFNL